MRLSRPRRDNQEREGEGEAPRGSDAVNLDSCYEHALGENTAAAKSGPAPASREGASSRSKCRSKANTWARTGRWEGLGEGLDRQQ